MKGRTTSFQLLTMRSKGKSWNWWTVDTHEAIVNLSLSARVLSEDRMSSNNRKFLSSRIVHKIARKEVLRITLPFSYPISISPASNKPWIEPGWTQAQSNQLRTDDQIPCCKFTMQKEMINCFHWWIYMTQLIESYDNSLQIKNQQQTLCSLSPLLKY